MLRGTIDQVLAIDRRLLQARREIGFKKLNGARVSLTIPELKLYEIVVFDYD